MRLTEGLFCLGVERLVVFEYWKLLLRQRHGRRAVLMTDFVVLSAAAIGGDGRGRQVLFLARQFDLHPNPDPFPKQFFAACAAPLSVD